MWETLRGGGTQPHSRMVPLYVMSLSIIYVATSLPYYELLRNCAVKSFLLALISFNRSTSLSKA